MVDQGSRFSVTVATLISAAWDGTSQTKLRGSVWLGGVGRLCMLRACLQAGHGHGHRSPGDEKVQIMRLFRRSSCRMDAWMDEDRLKSLWTGWIARSCRPSAVTSWGCCSRTTTSCRGLCRLSCLGRSRRCIACIIRYNSYFYRSCRSSTGTTTMAKTPGSSTTLKVHHAPPRRAVSRTGTG